MLNRGLPQNSRFARTAVRTAENDMKNKTPFLDPMIFGLTLMIWGAIGWIVVNASVDAGKEELVDKQVQPTIQQLENRSLVMAPVLVGGIVFACGLLARVKPDTARHAKPAATSVALLGALACTGRGWSFLLGQNATPDRWGSAIFLLLVAVACWTFVVRSIHNRLKPPAESPVDS